jgi:enolase-phosphatase E1
MATAILLDIEGTTTPIDFVHKTLFPFAKARMPAYVRENFDELRAEIEQLSEERSADAAYKEALDRADPASVSKYLEYLSDQDRKSTPLKSIQGKIWQAGYESGELRSLVFDDVPPAFEKWKTAGKTIAIYSSGSVLAQQLLFRYTDHGDLTLFISNYFDTNIGGKREPDSYKRIAEDLETAPGDVLFVSDIVPELDAARQAGMNTALSLRPGNAEIVGDTIHEIITTFADLAV